MTMPASGTRGSSRFASWLCLILVGAGAAALAAAAALNGDRLALALVASLLLVPLVAVAAVESARGREPYAAAVAGLLVIIQSANFRFRDIADKSLDWQVVLKLAGLGLVVLLVLPHTVAALRRPMARTAVMWLALCAFLVTSAAYAVAPAYSFVAAGSLLVSLMLIAQMGARYGRTRLAELMAATTLALCAASVVVYFAWPAFGHMSDWRNGAYVVTSRLQGLFGSANAAGAAGAFGLMLLVMLVESWRLPMRIAAGFCFLFCLVVSDNRMAIGCTLLALGVYTALKGRVAVRASLLLLAAGIVLAVLAVHGDALLAGLARSGSADEVLSATGRTRVWEVVLALWAEHPVLGYGYASAQSILPVHPLLFKAAAHTHNLYLELLFGGGLIGLTLLVASLASSVGDAVRAGDRAALAMLAFFLAYGMTEPVLSSLASLPAFALFTAAILPTLAPAPVPRRGETHA